MPIRLALSLHAPEDALRSQIMPVNERYPLAEVLAACEALLRAPAPPGVRRVRDARRRQRRLRAGASSSPSCSTRAIYKVNLIPYNPTGSLRRLVARRDRRLQGRARGARPARDGPPHARARHRRRLRPARREGRVTAGVGAGAAAGALLARAQQAVAQRGLLLRARVPLRERRAARRASAARTASGTAAWCGRARRRTASGRPPRSARARPARRSPTPTRRRGCARPRAARPAAGRRRSPASRPARA